MKNEIKFANCGYENLRRIIGAFTFSNFLERVNRVVKK